MDDVTNMVELELQLDGSAFVVLLLVLIAGALGFFVSCVATLPRNMPQC